MGASALAADGNAQPSGGAGSIADLFDREGYAVLRGALLGEEVDAFWSEFEMLRAADGLLLYAEHGSVHRGDEPVIADRRRELRAINTQNRSPRARGLAMHPALAPTIEALAGQTVGCIQTLCYSVSSRQGAHSDKFLVAPSYIGPYDRNSLVASWIACEDAGEENGGLVIFPGSHRLPKSTVYDFGCDYGRYVSYLEDLCRVHDIAPQCFHARKGDVLIWHGDFVHAGGIPRDASLGRASLVCHYAAVPPDAVLAHGGAVWRVAGGLVYGGADS
ncbi:hypothetical protein STAQ_36730 [Allostella sp. ATCC 35155]|nr:hypothetical protein STAQ_36730 [Stella sp. ATCC 35155]